MTFKSTDIDELSTSAVIERIVELNHDLARFWSSSDGWAPIQAALLLSKARLDRQLSLSKTLNLWVLKPPLKLSEGELILAWVNLGSLAEGTLKLFLSVYYKDYLQETLKTTTLKITEKNGNLIEPEALYLETMRQFFEKKTLLNPADLEFVSLVQKRRNAIHAFKDREIGNSDEFYQAIRGYLVLLRNINCQLPYPDDCYIPNET